MADTKGYIMYKSIYMTFYKRQTYSSKFRSAASKDWELGRKLTSKGHEGILKAKEYLVSSLWK